VRATVLYRVTGCVIIGCMLLAWPLSAVTHSLLALETIVLVSFGLAWLVKGRKILSGG
jgi:hypothetical protein